METSTKPVVEMPPQSGALPKSTTVYSATPQNMAERLAAIEGIGQRVGHIIQSVRDMVDSTGTSGEAKEKAVLAFYERLVMIEKQLAKIHDGFRLE